MESKLKDLSAREYTRIVGEAFRYAKSTFVTRTRKFDGKYMQVKSSRDEWDNLETETEHSIDLEWSNSRTLWKLQKNTQKTLEIKHLNWAGLVTSLLKTAPPLPLTRAPFDLSLPYISPVLVCVLTLGSYTPSLAKKILTAARASAIQIQLHHHLHRDESLLHMCPSVSIFYFLSFIKKKNVEFDHDSNISRLLG